MFSLQNILPAILGFAIGSIWILYKLGWLESNKINDKYGIIIPSLVTVALPFIFTYISFNFSLIKDLAPLGIFFTIAIGFLNYFWNQKTKTDEETTKQAILALERAYEILTDNGKNINPPLPDRYNWLATARMLVKYKKLKAKLKTDLYKIICEEQEQYWTHRFYLLIKDHNLYPDKYFEESYRDSIKPDSAAIIFGFAVLGFPNLKELNNTEEIKKKLRGSLEMHDSLIKYLKKYFDNESVQSDELRNDIFVLILLLSDEEQY